MVAAAPTYSSQYTAALPDMSGMSREDLYNLQQQLQNTISQIPGQDPNAAPQIRNGAFSDPTKDAYGGGGSRPLMDTIFKAPSLSYQYQTYMGRGKDKAAKAAYEQAQAQELARLNADRVQQQGLVQNAMKTLDLRDQVNQQYSNQDLGKLYDSIGSTEMKNALNQITQQYGDLNRSTVFGEAGQGLLGSSVDAEARSRVAQGQQTAAVTAANGVQGDVNNLKQQNEQQRQSLLSTVSGDDPTSQAQIDAQIAGIRNQTTSYGQQVAGGIAGWQNNTAGLNGQSQVLGNLLTSYGNLYNGGAGSSNSSNTGNSGNNYYAQVAANTVGNQTGGSRVGY